MFDSHLVPRKETHIVDAASLAHYGFLVSVRSLNLENVSESSIPIEHLASLVACVKDNVTIGGYSRYSGRSTDLLAILDNVQCECVSIVNILYAEEYSALFRAMKTRVRKLCFNCVLCFSIEKLYEELKKYDGKGKCEQIDFLYNVKLPFRPLILLWVKDFKWKVLA